MNSNIVYFRITNRLGRKIRLAVEPEGNLVDLDIGESVSVQVLPGEPSSLDLQLREDSQGLYLAIWPENGNYEIV